MLHLSKRSRINVYACVYDQGFIDSRIQIIQTKAQNKTVQNSHFVCVKLTDPVARSYYTLHFGFPETSISNSIHTHILVRAYSTCTVTHRQPCLTYDTEGLPGETQSPLPSSVATAASGRPDANDVLQTKHNDHYKLLQIATQHHIISLTTLYSNTLGCARKLNTQAFILLSNVTIYFNKSFQIQIPFCDCSKYRGIRFSPHLKQQIYSP